VLVLFLFLFCFFFWLFFSVKGRKNFDTVWLNCMYKFSTEKFIFFSKSHLGFIQYSQNFANFRLDILIKCIPIENKEYTSTELVPVQCTSQY